MVLPDGSEFGSRGSDSSGPFEILYASRASSPSRGCPVMSWAWLANRRSPSATSSGPTVQKTTMLAFPRSDIGDPLLLRPQVQRGAAGTTSVPELQGPRRPSGPPVDGSTVTLDAQAMSGCASAFVGGRECPGSPGGSADPWRPRGYAGVTE